MCWHRKDFSALRPIIRNDEDCIEDLQGCAYYIAGTVDSSLTSKSDLYDVAVNLNDNKIVIAPHAAEDMRMNSAHKEVAQIMSEVGENGSSSDMIEAISKKTGEIIAQLKSLSSNDILSEELLNEKVANESSRNWLLRLSYSEGLI